MTADDLPKLKLKWAFGYANVNAARAQPAYAGGRLFVSSENAEVHALDPKTGCTYWTFVANSGVRTALSVGPYKAAGRSGYAVYFGDMKAYAYAVDATTGQQIWARKVDDHPSAAITGAPTVHAGRVYVPVQGLNEEGQGGRGGYQCCTFRGSVSSLDASTGAVVWKTYTVEEPKPRAKNKDGVQMFGPAGGGIWAAPTVDPQRGFVYVATGNGYAEPEQKTTDAVIALDMKTGAVKWVNQTTPNDLWTMGCRPQNPDNPSCPATLGPDFDFSASPSLTRINGRDLLVLPQKSGMTYALDPDNEGKLVWQQRTGRGSGFGGQWGAAADEQNAYVGVGDMQSPTPGGLRALKLATGELAWSMEAPARLCNTAKSCRAGQGGAVTVIPGAVLSGSLDGGMRAYSTKDGSILWTFDYQPIVRHGERCDGHRRRHRRPGGHRRQWHGVFQCRVRRNPQPTGQCAPRLRDGLTLNVTLILGTLCSHRRAVGHGRGRVSRAVRAQAGAKPVPFGQETPSADALMVEKVKPNLYVLRGGGGNTAAFITDAGVVLVDTKLPGWGQPLIRS